MFNVQPTTNHPTTRTIATSSATRSQAMRSFDVGFMPRLSGVRNNYGVTTIWNCSLLTLTLPFVTWTWAV